ncbi:uncharacterized protein L201_000695 [Kwoniella dendrophila CBS 6074]|uniref:Uncharacterized protein n=1 Tax=Kwoniella dendrophila CBS 6074 TaxID=1295534 RepID=A0AAX4JN39_9TREE
MDNSMKQNLRNLNPSAQSFTPSSYTGASSTATTDTATHTDNDRQLRCSNRFFHGDTETITLPSDICITQHLDRKPKIWCSKRCASNVAIDAANRRDRGPVTAYPKGKIPKLFLEGGPRLISESDIATSNPDFIGMADSMSIMHEGHVDSEANFVRNKNLLDLTEHWNENIGRQSDVIVRWMITDASHFTPTARRSRVSVPSIIVTDEEDNPDHIVKGIESLFN